MYCPWNVINYCGDLRDGSVSEPQNYWVNTSSNDIIRRFPGRANASAREEIEALINGESVKNSAGLCRNPSQQPCNKPRRCYCLRGLQLEGDFPMYFLNCLEKMYGSAYPTDVAVSRTDFPSVSIRCA